MSNEMRKLKGRERKRGAMECGASAAAAAAVLCGRVSCSSSERESGLAYFWVISVENENWKNLRATLGNYGLL